MKSKFKTPGSHSNSDEALNLTDIAGDLVQEANFYALATDDLPDLTTAEFALQLSKMLSTETIRFFMESGDYGRGFLAGIAVGIFTLEQAVDVAMAERAAEVGGEDELSDEELEDMIYTGVSEGLRGGRKGNKDGENH